MVSAYRITRERVGYAVAAFRSERDPFGPGFDRYFVRSSAIACGLGAAARLAAPAVRVTDAGGAAGSGDWSRSRRPGGADGCRPRTCARRWFPGFRSRGAWLSAALDAQAGHLMQVTDEVSRQLAELQLTLGEGPVA